MSKTITNTTAAEVNQFNREWEEFEMWRDGVVKNNTLPKTRLYDFDYDAPDEPVWFKNLQKAWTSTQRRKALKEAINERNSGVQTPSLNEVKQNPHLWRDYCEEREVKRKPGRPKLPPEQRKSPKDRVKRSDLMKQLLSAHGITVNKNNGLEPASAYEGWIFLPNGRICFEDEASISVHAFLRDYY